jgi:hypothetical protein
MRATSHLFWHLVILLVLMLLVGCAPLPTITGEPMGPSTSAAQGSAANQTPSPTATRPSEAAPPMVGTWFPPGVTVPPTPGNGPSTGRSVNVNDDGKTITLPVGRQFMLVLGEGYDWNVTVADPSIVSQVMNAQTIPGSQGLYQARRPGTTTLSASGDPLCRKQRPACGMPSRLFEIKIVVAAQATPMSSSTVVSPSVVSIAG